MRPPRPRRRRCNVFAILTKALPSGRDRSTNDARQPGAAGQDQGEIGRNVQRSRRAPRVRGGGALRHRAASLPNAGASRGSAARCAKHDDGRWSERSHKSQASSPRLCRRGDGLRDHPRVSTRRPTTSVLLDVMEQKPTREAGPRGGPPSRPCLTACLRMLGRRKRRRHMGGRRHLARTVQIKLDEYPHPRRIATTIVVSFLPFCRRPRRTPYCAGGF